MNSEKIKELELENEKLRLELEKAKLEIEKTRVEMSYDWKYWIWAIVAIAGFLYATFRNLYS
ncbi:MAG: hypothetical protein Q3988_05315 [Gemella sp.]|nr:hypothetical protein [Gemella sp.]